jgi:hypothetical protein
MLRAGRLPPRKICCVESPHQEEPRQSGGLPGHITSGPWRELPWQTCTIGATKLPLHYGPITVHSRHAFVVSADALKGQRPNGESIVSGIMKPFQLGMNWSRFTDVHPERDGQYPVQNLDVRDHISQPVKK